jgi:hypothetical protein
MTLQVFTTNFPPQNAPVVDANNNVTNTFMAFFRDLYNRTGAGNGLVVKVDRGSPITIASDWNLIDPVVIGVPTNLPALTGGQSVLVKNINGGTALTVKPPAGATIDGAASYSIPATKMQIFWFFSATQIFSTQLG